MSAVCRGHRGGISMWIADQWQDYELLDCGGGEKLERWDRQYLVRPDPQAIWAQLVVCGAAQMMHFLKSGTFTSAFQPSSLW